MNIIIVINSHNFTLSNLIFTEIEPLYVIPR